MIKTVLRATLLLGFAATLLTGTAEARGFGGFRGGGFHGGGFHGGFHHRQFRHRFVGFGSFGGCRPRRFVDAFGRVVVRRFCD